MNLLNALTFRRQLQLITAIAALLLLIALAAGLQLVQRYNDIGRQVQEGELPELRHWSSTLSDLGRIHTELVVVAAAALHPVPQPDGSTPSVVQRCARLMMQINELSAKVGDYPSDAAAISATSTQLAQRDPMNAADLALIEKIVAGVHRYIDEASLALDGFPLDAPAADRHRVQAALHLTGLNQQLAQVFEARHSQLERNLQQRLRDMQNQVALAGMGLLVLSGLLFLLLGRITRHLAQTFATISDTLAALHADNTQVHIPAADTATEYGRVLASLAQFRQTLIERSAHEQALLAARYAAEDANRLKSDFMANISHELRTPLNGIVGMGELALLTDDDAERREYLQHLQQSSAELTGLINNLLDFAKLDSAVLPPPRSFDLAPTVAVMLEPYRHAAARKGLRLTSELPADLPTALIGHPQPLMQVLGSLLDNAIKFSEQGDIMLCVTRINAATSGLAESAHAPITPALDRPAALLTSMADDHPRAMEHPSHACSTFTLQFAVSDQGIGIAAEQQAQVLGGFTQADGSRTRKHGGIGLGLGLAARRVMQMGGTLQLESAVGAGSRFFFTLTLGHGESGNRGNTDAHGMTGSGSMAHRSDHCADHFTNHFNYTAAISAIAAQDTETFAMLAPIFIEHHAADLTRLKDAVANDNASEIRAQALGLAGTLAFFGTTPALQLANAIADSVANVAVHPDAHRTDDTLSQLEAALKQLVTALADTLVTPSPPSP